MANAEQVRSWKVIYAEFIERFERKILLLSLYVNCITKYRYTGQDDDDMYST